MVMVTRQGPKSDVIVFALSTLMIDCDELVAIQQPDVGAIKFLRIDAY